MSYKQIGQYFIAVIILLVITYIINGLNFNNELFIGAMAGMALLRTFEEK